MSTNSVIGLVAVAPVYREPDLRAEQVTQLVLGETGRILEGDGVWRRVRL
ncbi:MAG: hydrolase Nlp/P60, partial [Gemmatimonadales bacterium]